MTNKNTEDTDVPIDSDPTNRASDAASDDAVEAVEAALDEAHAADIADAVSVAADDFVNADAEDVDEAHDDVAEGDEEEDDGTAERLFMPAEVLAIRKEAEDRFLRLAAEYDNFRRRTARERERWASEGLESFLKSLLPVFDSFDKARTMQTDDAGAVLAGLELTYKQLQTALAANDVDVIDPVGEPFDPQFHEALMKRPSDEHEDGTMIEVFERGYKLGDRLVRAARGVVAGGD